ncbi:MAG: SUMF1/EgtB/PvdO family nonheme iron enzyme [Candidatus Hydrogenedentales bacterium]
MRNRLLVSILVLATALLMTSCSKPQEGLQAEFRSNVSTGAAPLTVEFTDLSTAGDSPIASWLWDFGDGGKATSTQQDPSHTYTAAGTYNVSLTVKTAEGEDTETKSNFISVTQGAEGEGEGEGEHQLGDIETILLPGGVPLELVWIPAGTFLMGRYAGEQDSYGEEDPQHPVTLNGFWMGKYELTKAQWTAVMGTTPWSGQSYVLDDPNSPAVYVSWNDGQAFMSALNSYTGKTFGLPSEAQWEYACRADTTTRFYWGDDPSYAEIGGYVWYEANTCKAGQQYAHVVGQKLPNAFGLYDMSGNVWEWCQDYWHDNYTGAPTDGSAWELPTGSYRVLRVGSWRCYDSLCRSANRVNYGYPAYASFVNGVRVSRTP